MIDEDPAAGRAGTPELTLAELIDVRLRRAGFTPEHELIARIRHHNALAAEAAARRARAAEARRLG